MTTIKNIVFDLGGVILDLDRDRAVKRFIEIGVADAEQLVDAYEQKGLFLELENGTLTAAEFCRKLSDHTGKELTEPMIHDAWMGFVVDIPQQKLDYILALKNDYNVYLLSNTNPFIMAWARDSGFTPAGRPLTAYFHKLYASYEIGITKPDSRIFDYMRQDAGLNPGETLFVDDGIKNIQAASALGYQTYQPLNKEDWRGAIDRMLGR
ncbi:MAG: HAD family phosphatase [Tannerellaceae bacterium]